MKIVQVSIYEYRDEDAYKQALDYMQDDLGDTYGNGELVITRKIIPYGDEHFISLEDGAWSMQHSVMCRPDLLSCRFHHAAEKLSLEGAFDPAPNGKYQIIDGAETNTYIIQPWEGD